jgi:hypothetical protein
MIQILPIEKSASSRIRSQVIHLGHFIHLSDQIKTIFAAALSGPDLNNW